MFFNLVFAGIKTFCSFQLYCLVVVVVIDITANPFYATGPFLDPLET